MGEHAELRDRAIFFVLCHFDDWFTIAEAQQAIADYRDSHGRLADELGKGWGFYHHVGRVLREAWKDGLAERDPPDRKGNRIRYRWIDKRDE